MDRQEKKSQRDLKRKVKKKKIYMYIHTHIRVQEKVKQREREREKGRGREKIFAIDESVREGERKKERKTHVRGTRTIRSHEYPRLYYFYKNCQNVDFRGSASSSSTYY